jgi:hypothetical protein
MVVGYFVDMMSAPRATVRDKAHSRVAFTQPWLASREIIGWDSRAVADICAAINK